MEVSAYSFPSALRQPHALDLFLLFVSVVVVRKPLRKHLKNLKVRYSDLAQELVRAEWLRVLIVIIILQKGLDRGVADLCPYERFCYPPASRAYQVRRRRANPFVDTSRRRARGSTFPTPRFPVNTTRFLLFFWISSIALR